VSRLAVIRAARTINRALDQREGSPEAALDLVDKAFRLMDLDDSSLGHLHRGRGFHLRAEIYLDMGQIDRCIDCYADADRSYGVAGSLARETRVRFLHDVVLTLVSVGMDETARFYIARGRALSSGRQAKYRSDFVRLSLMSEVVVSSGYEDYKTRALEAISEVANPSEARGLIGQLARAMAEFGSEEELDEIPDIIRMLLPEATSPDMRYATLAPLAFSITRSRRAIPDDLAQEIEHLADSLQTSRQWRTRSEVESLRAVCRWTRGQVVDALKPALRAVALLDAESWSVGASTVRLLSGIASDIARHVALVVACELNDAPVVAELIETSRLQAVPDPQAQSFQTTMLGEQETEILQRKLLPVHPVSVAGRSRLKEFLPEEMPLGKELRLEGGIETVGGIKAWWWGCWLGANGVLFWAVRDPTGKYTCGSLSGGATADQEGILPEAINNIPGGPPKGVDSQHGPYNRSYLAEEEFSTSLGAFLLPPSLAVGIAKAFRVQQAPVQLVVAGNFLSRFPLPLVAVGSIDDEHPVRLIEVAVIRVAPPLAVLIWITPGSASNLPLPLAAVCMDPTEDLSHAVFDVEAETVLAGAKVRRDRPGAIAATKANLLEVLRRNRGRPAIFAFSGHAHPGEAGSDFESSLPLEDQGEITSQELFTFAGGSPLLPMPQRVLLSCCGSAGSTGAGRGEWLGLATGCLISGASEVVATAWPIWDTAFTSRFDSELLRALRTAQDPATALRDLQLDCLKEWRESAIDYSEAPVSAKSSEPLPLIWAAYQSFGVLPKH
jgi:hypothetical protein